MAAEKSEESPHRMSELRAGFARRDITQPVGTPSIIGLRTRVEEIWDPLTATVLVLEFDGLRAALVGLDVAGVLEASHRAIRSAVSSTIGIPPDFVVVGASHTHCGPYLSLELQEVLQPHGLQVMDSAYADLLTERIADAAAEAADRAAPVAVQVGRGIVERVAGNRRPKLPDGRTVHRYGRPPEELRELPEGLIDPRVSVVRFDSTDGRPLGALLSYACHPTAASEGITRWVSADFVGVGRRRIEAEFGFPCLFLQGCGGNIGTGKWVAGTAREDTDAMGERFARGIAAALAGVRPVAGPDIRAGVHSVRLELDPFPPLEELEHRLAEAAVRDDFGPIISLGDAFVVARRAEDLRQARLTAISIGDLALAVLPGEVFLEHGLAIEAGSPFATTIVVAYNDNTLQYIPTAAAFPDGEYEVNGGWRYIRPGEGERMASEMIGLLGRL